MEELPSILKDVDILSVLGVEVTEGLDIQECKRNLRRLFLKKAKEHHPDKRKLDDDQDDVEFVRLKAAFDYLQDGDNFNVLFNKALNNLRIKKRRLEVSKHRSSKQAAYLDELLKREKEASKSPSTNDDKSRKTETYRSSDFDDPTSDYTSNSTFIKGEVGELIVAARTLKIANESEINCILLGSHFHKLFDNYGLVRVEPLDFIDSIDDINVRVGKIIFESHEHAIRALLHYRNNKTKFRTDIYALALGSPSKSNKNDNISLEDMEAKILSKFKLAGERRMKDLIKTN